MVYGSYIRLLWIMMVMKYDMKYDVYIRSKWSIKVIK